MGQTDLLRKLIREEVRAVFQEELATILKEAIISNKQPITEAVAPKKQTIPGTLNTQPVKRLSVPNLGANNPLKNLLAETAHSMSEDDMEGFSYDSGDAAGFPGMQSFAKEVPVVESVGGMLASARPSSNLDAIQINAVPDFTALMAKMQQNGEV